jgi:hypothetical protein
MRLFYNPINKFSTVWIINNSGEEFSSFYLASNFCFSDQSSPFHHCAIQLNHFQVIIFLDFVWTFLSINFTSISLAARTVANSRNGAVKSWKISSIFTDHFSKLNSENLNHKKLQEISSRRPERRQDYWWTERFRESITIEEDSGVYGFVAAFYVCSRSQPFDSQRILISTISISTFPYLLIFFHLSACFTL